MDKNLIYKTNNEKLITFIFGQLEKNSKKIEETCDVKLKISEEGILVSGSDINIESVGKLIESLDTHTLSGNEVTDQDLDYLLSNLEKIKQDNISKIKDYVICYNSKGKPLKPKTVNQRNYVEMINKNDIVFGIGPAGTGKTYLAMAMAINAFRNNEVDRIILTRPAVEAGESLGFLPGDLQEKIDPYLRPIYDAMFDILGYENFEKFKDRGLIEVAPLAYMRGRTLDNAYIILDEAQNTTNEQMKMFLTRIGYGSKAIVTGDITQVDLPRGKKSGLLVATNILRNIKGISFLEFEKTDVVRHPLVQKIIGAYENLENNRSNYDNTDK
ncbi:MULTISPECIES: PhoH family protein [Peptoniphilaceae]|uniref:PhoH-like protein n=1 Tax=Finegoldia magna BVS033A4 TaxID=866773 RepID=E1KVP5_FINMA|nr:MULTISPECIES: PhoH family protein [Peptoniphilaceae]EFL54862.1 PhoH family protein [Finegoldia magna BVS033A4]MDU5526038.1 PhoH family protein [Finegoldia magna]MDU6597853.1 PhoH family protein [Finegoldia magna]MDU7139849.1 PhoH family protein [Finegoldia magna]MDU7165728.1 PhoH family protein [Finegoldia magna]